MAPASPSQKPSPDRIFGVLNAFHSSAGRKTAQQNPNAHITAADWAPLLAVAKAKRGGGSNRSMAFRPGSVFEADLGEGYHVAP